MAFDEFPRDYLLSGERGLVLRFTRGPVDMRWTIEDPRRHRVVDGGFIDETSWASLNARLGGFDRDEFLALWRDTAFEVAGIPEIPEIPENLPSTAEAFLTIIRDYFVRITESLAEAAGVLTEATAAWAEADDDLVDITDSPEPDPEPLSYFPGVVEYRGRSSVRAPIDPCLHVRLHGPGGGPAELAMTVPMAVRLVEDLMGRLGEMVQRRDIHDALLRTEPGPV